jgi:MFS transporter, PAT family, beta-lactamase induction signal transducer AmpG
VQPPRHTPPPTFFFLVLPYGMSTGFVLATVQFVLTRPPNDLKVESAAAVVALGLSASMYSFLWGPMIDLTLTRRRWYAIGLALTVSMILVLNVIPLRPSLLLSAVVFLSQIATTWISLPNGGFMAHTVAEDHKGRAAGWAQAGNVGGSGLGAGAGVWLTAHYSFHAAAVVMSALMAACIFALALVPDIRITHEGWGERMRAIARDFWNMIRTPVALLVICLVSSPIGAGGVSNVWVSVAEDWHASADVVALTTGILSGVVSIPGCILAGWCADRFGRWRTFFGAGALMAVVALAMSFAPRTPLVYGVGVLTYSFTIGLAFAAYSALVLLAVGHGAASTKYAILNSLGNVPVVYMTALAGWSHDRFGPAGMLQVEFVASTAAIAVGMSAVWLLAATRAASPAAPPSPAASS